MIYDLRAAGSAGSFGRGDDNSQKLVGFFHQLLKSCCLDEIILHQQFHPEQRFIALFFNNTKFVDEVGIGLSATNRPIVRTC